MVLGGALNLVWPGRGIYVGRGPGGGSILGMAREVALYWAWPGGGSKSGMAREGALNWAWPGSGL